MTLLFTCDNFTWNLTHLHGLSFLFLESGTASIYHGGLATSISNFQNPSTPLPQHIIIYFPLSQILHLSRANPFSSSVLTNFTYLLFCLLHSSPHKPNFSTIKYHIIILSPLHNSVTTMNTHTHKNKKASYKTLYMFTRMLLKYVCKISLKL
ncbi:hypothetical protein VIGAN_02089900, partial [Vigna angularis var. angularis]